MSRTERIELRLSPDEHAAWKGAAKHEERSLSDFIRLRVNTSLRQNPLGTTQPAAPIPPRHWPVSETVPQEDRETLLDKTVDVSAITLPVDTALEDGGLTPVRQSPQGSEEHADAAPSSRPSCRMEAFHVKGRFCKVCSTVPS